MTEREQASDEPVLTVKEVSGRLRVSRFTVYRMIRDQAFPGTYRLRGSYRVPQAALLGYIASRQVD